MNYNNIQEAADKVGDLMTAKYGNSWFNIVKSEDEEDRIEIKPEYVSEYDEYYDKFLWN